MEKRQVVLLKAISYINGTTEDNLAVLEDIFNKLSTKSDDPVTQEAPAVKVDPVAIVEKEIEKETDPMTILTKLAHAPVEKEPTKELTREQCLSFITKQGLEFKDDPSTIDTPTLRSIVADINMTAEQDIVEKEVEPETSNEAFDYRNINIADIGGLEDDKEGSVDERINQLITKISGPRPQQRELRYIVDWQEKYTPQQILLCLRDSHNKSAQTLKHTDLMLKTRYGSGSQDQGGPQGMHAQGQSFGKFRMG